MIHRKRLSDSLTLINIHEAFKRLLIFSLRAVFMIQPASQDRIMFLANYYEKQIKCREVLVFFPQVESIDPKTTAVRKRSSSQFIGCDASLKSH